MIIEMRKNILVLFYVLLPIVALAQSEPNWYDNDQRRAFYPDSQYFTGYAEGQRMGGESVEAATTRLKDAAKVEAVSTIQVHIKNVTVNNALSTTLRTMEGTFRQSTRSLSSKTQTDVDIEIPGLNIESWRNPQNGAISAFAYVKKSTLIRQLEKKITVGLTKIETSLDQIDQLVSTGQKLQARDLAEKTLPQFAEVDKTQQLLVAVDSNADEESLMLSETRQLQNRLTGVIAELKNGLNIFLSCNAFAFGSNYTALKGEIQGELSKMGVTFVPSANKSDWAIYVTATAREYNHSSYGSVTTYFAYVDVKIAIDKTVTGQRIYEEQISEKGGHTLGYQQAARDGYKYISPMVVEKIKEHITQ